MSDILYRIVAAKEQEVAQRKAAFAPGELERQLAQQPTPRPFAQALRTNRAQGAVRGKGTQVNVIAELKPRSPSKGEFPWHGDPARTARAYQAGGARAMSVLTDQPFFGGSVELLQAARAACGLPVLMKDFVVDPWQVAYARAVGADAVLLIAAVLTGHRLAEALAEARRVGVATLVEVIDEEEMARANDAGAEVVGVNNRDLKTFTMDPERSLRLLALARPEQVFVTESGIRSRTDVERMLAAGVDAFLIGEALMTSPDPEGLLKELRGE
ncbi:MAG: indole-3-glycerol phosphate synthase TrpC [Deltaproteobacteria bacterium]|nr:indole-3-glycerol phosphate synthase TrpC [Deltaproteobacteria bacterium]